MNITILVGPPGSGKSTYCKTLLNHVRISQDDMGRDGHLKQFNEALEQGKDIVVDRMNFNKSQRARYLNPAKEKGYTTTIVVFYKSFDRCLSACMERPEHPTIKTLQSANDALHRFFKDYQFVTEDEADSIVRVDDEVFHKKNAVLVDLDGTLCDIEHRLHFVRTDGKKDWKGFFEGIINDRLNQNIYEIVDEEYFLKGRSVILCSGRPDDYRGITETWLKNKDVQYTKLLMRQRNDFRQDDIVKQIIYEFDIRPYYNVKYVLDDRNQVVNMWRRNGLTCLQVAEGNF